MEVSGIPRLFAPLFDTLAPVQIGRLFLQILEAMF